MSDYLPPVVVEVLMRTTGFSEGAAKVKAETSAMSDSISASTSRAASDVDKNATRIEDRSSSMGKKVSGAFQSIGSSIGGAVGAPLVKVGEQMDQTGSKADSLVGKLASIGKVATVGGLAGFAASAYEGVKAAEGFQTSLASIAANSGVTQKAADGIGNAFLGTMGKSIFSAQQMASAFAGVAGQLKLTEGHALSTADATKVMAAASDLAEASHESLGASTSALSSIMQAYHLSVGQAAGASDLLFNVSKSMNVPIDGVATAMERLHGRLGQLAPSMKDVGALMVDLAGHGVTGQRGVQVVNTALQTLIGGSKNTTAVLKALGVSVFDSSGHFVGLQNVIQQLQPKLADLTQHQQLFAEKALFGSAASQVMAQVIQGGIPDFEKAAETVGRMGTAHNAAALQAKTLHNQMETLKATVDDLGIKLGTFLIPKLEAVASAVSSVIGWLDKHKAAAEALAGVITGVLGVAITTFAYTKAQAFIGSVAQMVSSVTGLVTRSGTAATEVSAANTRMAESAETTAGQMRVSYTGMGTSWSGLGRQATTTAGTVETADEAIVESADATAAGVDAAIGSTGIGLVLIGLGIAAGELATHWSQAMSAMTTAVQDMARGAETILNGLISAFNSTIGQLTGEIGTIQGWGQGGQNAQQVVSGMANSSAKNFMSTPFGVPTGANGKPLPGWNSTVSVPSSGSNASRIASALAAQGFSKTVVAGILGNFAQETGGGTLSGINTRDSGTGASGMGGMGIAQWTAGRRVQEMAYAQSHHESATSLAAQVGYLVQELRTTYHSAYTQTAAATTPQQAAAIFNKLFEGGTDPNGIREKAAQQAYALLNSSSGTGGLGNSGIQALINSAATGKGKKVTYGPSQNVLNMLTEAQELVGAPYSKAGHASAYNETIAQIKKFGTDCSGLVSVLLKEGVSGIRAAQTTQGLPTAAGLAPGAGKYVTVYDRHTGPTDQEHTLIEILGKYFESGGNSKYNPSGGVSELTTAQAAGELAGGNFEAFHPTASYLNQAVKGGKAFNSAAANAALGTSINAVIGSWTTAANSLVTKLGDLMQASGNPTTLEKTLGVSTGGKVAGTLNRLISGANISQIESALGAGKNPAALDKSLIPTLEKASASSPQAQAMAALVAELRASGKTGIANELSSQWGAALSTLAQSLAALQMTKNAESLKLQATQETDQTKLTADLAKAQLQVVTDSQDLIVEQMTAAATQIKDTTAVITDQFQQLATSIQDATQGMADASNATVQGIQNQAQTQVDILGEKGLYGLGLIAQQETVQLDVMKAGFDQQIAAAQANVDATKAQWDATIAADQLALDQVQLTQDQLVAMAQQNETMVELHQDTLVQTATQHADTIALAQDLKVQLAQTAVDLSATAPASQQKLAQAVLARAQAQQAVQEANADAALQAVQNSAAVQENAAQNAYNVAQQTAAQQEATAAQTLATAQGQASVQEAYAAQALQTVQDTAAQQEAAAQATIDVTNAQQAALERGGGTFNPYSTLLVGAGGGQTLLGGGGPLPYAGAYSAGENGGQGGASTYVTQNITAQTNADPSTLASELVWLLKPYLAIS